MLSGAAIGRRLLGHCFTVTGGSGHAPASQTSSGGGASSPASANVTSANLDGADSWASVDHADPHTVRLIYWLSFILAAVGLLVLMLNWWPPPDRVFPRKRPVARVLPWCLLGRMLGYGVIDWREGKLTPFLRYFRERHEVLSLWMGDMQFITFRARLTHLAASMVCTASLSMGLTDLESARVTGDFWTHQVWIFGALFVYEIVLGIALRLAAIGASERAIAAPDTVHTRRMEIRLFAVCALFSLACGLTAVMFAHVMDESGGCGDGFNTFLAYSYVFGLYELFGWLFLHPVVISTRWVLGRVFLRFSTDAETDDETMDCCWKSCMPCLCGKCKPQPSAAVDSRGVAKVNPDDFDDGDEETGTPGSTNGMERVYGTSRVIWWKRTRAVATAKIAATAMREAAAAAEEAQALRTVLARAKAAAAAAAADAAQAEAQAAAARADLAEATALRAALPPKRESAPPMDPPTPQSIVKRFPSQGFMPSSPSRSHAGSMEVVDVVTPTLSPSGSMEVVGATSSTLSPSGVAAVFSHTSPGHDDADSPSTMEQSRVLGSPNRGIELASFTDKPQ